MKLPHSIPSPDGTERAARAKKLRDMATETARLRPHALTRANGEEVDYQSACFTANFTKGLRHNEFGVLARHADYAAFVEAINSDNDNLFSSGLFAAQHYKPLDGDPGIFRCTIPHKPKAGRMPCSCDAAPAKGDGPKAGDKVSPEWRGWESPRAGHVYELEGPDAGAVGMAPAPRVVSSELAAEVAEVYSLALLRDMRFTDIVAGTSKNLITGGSSALSSGEIAGHLSEMPFFKGVNLVSSSLRDCCKPCAPHVEGATDEATKARNDLSWKEAEEGKCLDRFERNRRFARTQSHQYPYTAALNSHSLFRGSTRGAMAGPYISQFMLMGAPSRVGGQCKDVKGADAAFGCADGYIQFGSQVIDQRSMVHEAGLDHMTEWNHWLDVQNGANLKGLDRFECTRRFITTPRDLATYVHYDALYQAYLNAVLILDALGTPVSKGFPEPSFADGKDGDSLAGLTLLTPARTGFATFGGPHILSLVTEVATRCLKAVRRQKFNFHRRARPEVMGGRMTLIECGEGGQLGCSEADFAHMLGEIPTPILDAIRKHNAAQNVAADFPRDIMCTPPEGSFAPDDKCNLLLPMAFPEGSPMHPAYGAGHATVAGGCVTMIKAFFEMFEDCDGALERPLCCEGKPVIFTPNADGSALVNHRFDADCNLVTEAEWGKLDKASQDAGCCKALTIQGELDKLAANIAIGRNMAGVHYYSDYYDSLRLGERVAVGILLEQAPTYNEQMETSFTSFDGDHITISGQGGSAGMLSVLDKHGNPVPPEEWWLRHVPGGQPLMDL